MLFANGCLIIPAPFVEKTPFSPTELLSLLSEARWLQFWRLSLCFLFCDLCLHLSQHHSLDDRSSVSKPYVGSGTVSLLTLFFFFKIVLDIQGSVPFHVNFRLSFPVSTKVLDRILIGISLNLCIDQFSGEPISFIMLSLPIHETSMPLHVFRSFFHFFHRFL